jgi:transposase
MRIKSQTDQNLEKVTPELIILGIDIAKHIHWAKFTDYRGVECGKAIKVENNINGFELILSKIKEICNSKKFFSITVGMEPTGHYWKPLANYLLSNDINVVLVNPYYTKCAKELDDNSPTKSDKKDALTIAKLVKDGRYFNLNLPHNIYAQLKELGNIRRFVQKERISLINAGIAVLDEYFPEYSNIFISPFDGKTTLHILKTCPFPEFIKEIGIEGVLSEIKKAVKGSIGIKKATQIVEVANKSIGVNYAQKAAKLKIRMMVETLELLNKQLEEIAEEMEKALEQTGLKDYLCSIKGIGIVSLAMCLGETGDLTRFEDPKQLVRLAGLNLKEISSGEHKGETHISKRGRKHLRCVLYQISVIMITVNAEMKQLYQYFLTRRKNPLKKKEALVVIAKKVLVLLHALATKKEYYDSEKVMGYVRKNQLSEVA